MGRPKAQAQRPAGSTGSTASDSRSSLRPPTAARAEGCLRLSGRLSTAAAVGQAPASGPGRDGDSPPGTRHAGDSDSRQ